MKPVKKLSLDDIAEIQRICALRRELPNERSLALKYGVSQPVISRIAHGRGYYAKFKRPPNGR